MTTVACPMTHIVLTMTDGMAEIALDRPSARNAMNQVMLLEILDALDRVRASPDIHVLVMTGGAEAFSAGADLPEALKDPPQDKQAPAAQVFRALAGLDIPILAAVSGVAVGAGATLALLCDVIYAAPSAQFHLPFTGLGLCPEGGVSYTLPERIGYGRAAEWLLFGDPVDADRALALGLVADIVRDGDVAAHARRRARRLVDTRSGVSLRETKRLLSLTRRPDLLYHIDMEFDRLVDLFGKPDAREAFQAFAEKRRPDFRPDRRQSGAAD